MSATNVRRILLHVVVATAILSLPLLFAPQGGGVLDRLENPGTQRDLWGYSFALVFFYLNYFLLIPKLFFEKRYFLYAMSIAVSFVLLSNHPSPVQQQERTELRQPPPRPNPQVPGMDQGEKGGISRVFPDFQHNLLRFTIVLFASFLMRTELRRIETEQQKLETELSFLKAQINPHFLFNALNTVYALAIEKSDDTEDAVARLSGMMRYMTSESSRELVTLRQEIDYISNYIEFQRLRFDDTLDLNLNIEGDPGALQIAPMLFIPFVENAFKYGVNPESTSTISISIRVSKSEVELRVFNRKVVKRPVSEPVSAMGIANIRSQLKLLYPGKHQLEIDENSDTFDVRLTIQLT